MPAGHGGAEGKRCAYFVDERYLASLGLMALEISYRIPNADIVPHNREITDWGLDLQSDCTNPHSSSEKSSHT